MITMTQGQQEALAGLRAFVKSNARSYLLDGYAGVGKTWLVSEFVRDLLQMGRRVIIAAPTHKACRVLRTKLTAAGIPWVFKGNKKTRPLGKAVVDTTAALLGVRPVIGENQNAKQRHFDRSTNTPLPYILDTLNPIVLVDEVSMLGRDDFLHLLSEMRKLNPRAKLIAVGDAGQLPPVNKKPIDFSTDFDGRYTLTQIVRQAEGNAIIAFAHAVRRSEPWWRISGPGLERTEDNALLDAYFNGLEAPVDDETQRRVYIAFENTAVNYVQMACCRRLYDHSPDEIRVGELLLAQDPYRAPESEDQLAAPGDQMRVVELGTPDPEFFGLPRVVVERIDLAPNESGREFEAYFLTSREWENTELPFVRKLKELESEAEKWKRAVRQRKAKNASFSEEHRKYKEAWSTFFDLKERVLNIAHPFAITAHKSQGSTYREAFIDAGNLTKFPKFGWAALYVAATRPSQRLVWAGGAPDPNAPDLE